MSRSLSLTRFRILTTLLALILAAGGLAPLAPSPVLAQADEISQRDFEDLLDEAEENDPIFGPEEGELEHDPEIVSLSYSGVDVADFVATATFLNPYAGSRQQFDMGIQFRSAPGDDGASFIRFIVLSSGVWAVTETGNEELVLSGEYEDLDIGRNGENDLTVIADGDLVHLGINGDYVGSAEVAIDDPGDIALGTAFLGDSYQDGAATEFVDFTIWSDEGGSGRSTDDPDEPDDPVVKGTRYDAESFAFHFTFGDEWELGGSSATDNVEFVQLSNGVSILQVVVGNVWEDQAKCVEALVGIILTNFEDQGLAGELSSDQGIVELEDSPFPGTFALEVVFEVEAGADFNDTVIYAECGPAGTNEYLAGVIQIVPADAYADEIGARKEIVATFNQEETRATDADDDNGTTSTNSGTQVSAHVTEDEDGNRFYVSPTFGFVVGILPGFTIEEDSVANGYDTLVVADKVSRVTVSGFASTNTPSGCIDSILTNLRNDPTITEVEIALDTEGESFRYDSESQSEIAVYLYFNTGGNQFVLGRYYACFANEAHTSMLVVAYETDADVFPDEFENVDIMLSLIRVP